MLSPKLFQRWIDVERCVLLNSCVLCLMEDMLTV